MRLKPCLIPSGTLILGLEPGNYGWIGDFLDEELGLHRASYVCVHEMFPCRHELGR